MKKQFFFLVFFALLSSVGYSQTTKTKVTDTKVTEAKAVDTKKNATKLNETNPQKNTVKAVPSASKSKAAIKMASEQATAARKQQLKKAVRKSNMTRRSIKRR